VAAGRRPAAARRPSYRDQLVELERDVAAGLIGTAEADTARVEITRRLLSAVDRQPESPVASNTAAP
jgi:cytochrome c-type biogenesis protein CcmH